MVPEPCGCNVAEREGMPPCRRPPLRVGDSPRLAHELCSASLWAAPRTGCQKERVSSLESQQPQPARDACEWMVGFVSLLRFKKFRPLVIRWIAAFFRAALSCPPVAKALLFRPSPRLQLSSTKMQAAKPVRTGTARVHVLLALAVASVNASNASSQPAAIASSTATPEGERVASVNLQDNFGCTALMHASINGRTSTVQLMLDFKADASLQSIDGSTALMLAEYHNHTATAQVLRQHAKRSTATAEARWALVMADFLAEMEDKAAAELEDKELSGACGSRHAYLYTTDQELDLSAPVELEEGNFESTLTEATLAEATLAKADPSGPPPSNTPPPTPPPPPPSPPLLPSPPTCPSATSPGWWTGGGGGSASPFHSPAFSFKYIRGDGYQGDAARLRVL